jgi:hypothetical protein
VIVLLLVIFGIFNIIYLKNSSDAISSMEDYYEDDNNNEAIILESEPYESEPDSI